MTGVISKPGSTSSKKLAVAVHLYYPALWPEIAAHLKKVTHPFDLYVTTSPEESAEVDTTVSADFPGSCIQVKPNRGMDIVPFLECVPQWVEEGYLAVCKLHTKKGHGEYGPLWRDVLLDSLVGDNASFAACAAAFARHPELQMIGPASLYLSARQLMLDNEPALAAVLEHFGYGSLPERDWGFFSGTMFWSRPALLVDLAHYVLQNPGQFEVSYQRDGQLVHAIERLFGLLPVIKRGQVGLLHRNHSLSSPAYTLQMSSPMTHINRANLDELLRQYAFLEEGKERLRQSASFDSEYYRRQHPFLTHTALDLMVHYLVIGRFNHYEFQKGCTQQKVLLRSG